MSANIKKHFLYYLSLLAILAGGFLAAFLASYDRSLQITVIFLTICLYIFWGILHHFLNHDLRVKIVVEYLLMGGLAMSIITLIL